MEWKSLKAGINITAQSLLTFIPLIPLLLLSLCFSDSYSLTGVKLNSSPQGNCILLFPSLHSHLVEHLNAEIVLQTISDVKMALDWIRSTFLYIRALRNPTHYGQSSEHRQN